MKTKRRFLIRQSLKKKINTKWFKIANIVIFISMILLVNIDSVISLFGGDFKEENQIILIDEVGVYEGFKLVYEQINETTGLSSNYVVEKSDKKLEELQNTVKEEKSNNIIIKIASAETNYMSAEVYTYDPISDTDFQIVSAVINNVKSSYALANSGISEELLASINAPVEVSRLNLNPDIDENASSKMLVGNVISFLFVIPFFIFIMLLVQMLGAEVNDEKTTRSMEIIISNVSPKTHFIAKIAGSLIFVLMQLGLMLLYTVAGAIVRVLLTGGGGIVDTNGATEIIGQVVNVFKTSGIIEMLPYAVPLILLLLILCLVGYALFAGILASVTTNIEDFQQLQSPIMIICMSGYFLAFMATAFEGSIFIKVMSYIPFISGMIAPTLFFVGQTTVFELLLSIALMGVTCFLLFRYGLRIYKVGILNYSSKGLWKMMFKSLKNK